MGPWDHVAIGLVVCSLDPVIRSHGLMVLWSDCSVFSALCAMRSALCSLGPLVSWSYRFRTLRQIELAIDSLVSNERFMLSFLH